MPKQQKRETNERERSEPLTETVNIDNGDSSAKTDRTKRESSRQGSEQDIEIEIDGIIKQLGPVKTIQKQIHLYVPEVGLWLYHDNEHVRHIIQPWMAKIGKETDRQMDDFVGRIATRTYVDPKRPEGMLFHGVYYDARSNLNVICTPNEVLVMNMKTGEIAIEKHSADWEFCESIATPYIVDEKCPKYDEQMDRRQPEAEDQELLDFFGWLTLIGHNKHESTILVNLGDPDTGKSTYSDILIALIGEWLCSDIMHKFYTFEHILNTCRPKWQFRGPPEYRLSEAQLQQVEELALFSVRSKKWRIILACVGKPSTT